MCTQLRTLRTGSYAPGYTCPSVLFVLSGYFCSIQHIYLTKCLVRFIGTLLFHTTYKPDHVYYLFYVDIVLFHTTYKLDHVYYLFYVDIVLFHTTYIHDQVSYPFYRDIYFTIVFDRSLNS